MEEEDTQDSLHEEEDHHLKEDFDEFESILTFEAREDFGGLDNDALDFSQLEDFIVSDPNGAAAINYFADSLSHPPSASCPPPPPQDKRLIVLNSSDPSLHPHHVSHQPPQPHLHNHHHHLPDSPPDSGSEPPYSPTDQQQVNGSRSPSTNPNHKMNGRGGMLYHDLTIPALHHGGGSITVVDQSQSASSSSTEQQPPFVYATLQPVGVGVGVSQQPAPPPAQEEHQHQMVQSSSLASSTSQPIAQPQAQGKGGRKRKGNGANDANSKQGKIVVPVHIHGNPQGVVKQEPEILSPSDIKTVVTTNGVGHSEVSADDEEGFFDLPSSPHERSGGSSEGSSLYNQQIQGDSGSTTGSYLCIKFQPFQEENWHTLADEGFKELPMTFFKVDADKGFNFSIADDAFVCQKKNHFQITCHARLQGGSPPAKYIKTETEGYKPVEGFYIHFFGVKAETPNQSIKIEQSQSDRSKKPFHPVAIQLSSETVAKLTVGRLHFNETTSNNMRKKGKPNPDQRYFYLVVALHAHTLEGGSFPIVSYASQRIIVRASNPGQFESDMELCWQKGQSPDSIYHAGRVGINMDRPEEALVVYGNCKITGQIIHPSDIRAKSDVTEVDSKQQLRNVQQLRVVRYKYNPEFSKMMGLHDGEDEIVDTGVIAQEVQKIIPEAVKESGNIDLPNGDKINNFLVVNKDRIFMENIGAVKELCNVTGKLEMRIDHLEKITLKNNKASRGGSTKSSRSNSSSTKSSSSSTRSEYLCSNRFVQLLIVILVLVMAFCLVAMATLYMLEYHKRSSTPPEPFHHLNHHTPHGGIHTSSHPFTHPPYVSLNSSTSTTRITMTTMTTMASKNLKLKVYPNNSNSPSPSKPTEVQDRDREQGYSHFVLSKKKPKVLGKPSYCYSPLPYLDTHCESFCCSGSSVLSAPPPPEFPTSVDNERSNQVLVSPPSPASAILQGNSNNVSSEDAISNFSSNPVHRNGLDSRRRKRRRRRQTDSENPRLITVPSIRILSQTQNTINHTLDASYCMVNSVGFHDCVSTDNRYFSSANLTYHVPLSKYWDEVALQLIFKFSSNPRVNISSPKICGEFYDPQKCRKSGRAMEEDSNTNAVKDAGEEEEEEQTQPLPDGSSSSPSSPQNEGEKTRIRISKKKKIKNSDNKVSTDPKDDVEEGEEKDRFLIKKEENNIFSLNLGRVGLSPYSRFNIRFTGDEELVQDLCIPPSSKKNKNIFEFNFHFYRVCHD